jgi:hypothetical protein
MPEKVSRDVAISHLRARLLEVLDRGQSVCQFAAEQGILCGGFSHYDDADLRDAYRDITRLDPFMSRESLEKAANDWQLARQAELGVVLSCDAQRATYETCRGWDEFTNAELAAFCRQFRGEEFEVLGEPSPAVI